MVRGTEILDAIGTNHPDSHQLSIEQPLVSAEYPPCDRGAIVRFDGAIETQDVKQLIDVWTADVLGPLDLTTQSIW